jgi:hypothetical protein
MRVFPDDVGSGTVTDILTGTPLTASGTAVSNITINTVAQGASGNRALVCAITTNSTAATITAPANWTELDETAYATPSTKEWTGWAADTYPASMTLTENAAFNMAAMSFQLAAPTPPLQAPFTETFTGTNGTAPGNWTVRAGTGTIQTNAFQLVPQAVAFSYGRADLTNMVAMGDTEVTGTLVGATAGVEQYIEIHLNSDAGTTSNNWEPTNGYVLLLGFDPTAANGYLRLSDSTAGSVTTLTQITKSLTGNTKYAYRFQRLGTILRARVWDNAGAEPSSWELIAPSPVTAKTGKVGVLIGNGSAATGRTFTFDDVAVSVPPAIPPATVLNIGAAGTKNHFDVQVAPTGGTVIATHTMAEIEAGYSESPYFDTVNDGNNWARFYARMDAPTTSGATFSRSELREVNADGSAAAFDALVGEHIMQGTTKITHLPPSKPEVVIAQLHNGSSDRVAIRTQVISAATKLLVRVNGSAVTPRMDEAYVAGTAFTWKIRVINGLLEVYYNDMVTPLLTSSALVSTGSPSWYFKAGLYNQSNTTTDVATEYGESMLRSLSVSHAAPGYQTTQFFAFF